MNKKKRDLVEEIKLIKSRSEFDSRYDYSARLDDIEYALKEFVEYNGNFNNELLKYIPISTVACFEAFFRSTVKELVDFGKPYSTNVAKFNQANNVKLDFEIVSAIQSKSLTVGEFVGHILSYNNYDEIATNLSVILQMDFTEELKKFNKISISEQLNSKTEDFKNRFGEILNSVKRTYELRHIFCHEFATNLEVDQNEILENYANCKLFLEHTNNVIYEILYPNAPETQLDMNLDAALKFEIKEKELDELVAAIKSFVSKDEFETERFKIDQFDKCMEQWKIYRKLHAEYKSGLFKSGSMYPLVYASDLEMITNHKISSLKEEFAFVLRKSNFG